MMMIFTRGSDAAKYITLLSDMLEHIGEDFSQCLKIAGIDVTTEEILDSYQRSINGPSALESILIREGKLSNEEVERNYLMESVFNELKFRWNSK